MVSTYFVYPKLHVTVAIWTVPSVMLLMFTNY